MSLTLDHNPKSDQGGGRLHFLGSLYSRDYTVLSNALDESVKHQTLHCVDYTQCFITRLL